MSKDTNLEKTYEVITQEDPETGDLILPIPQPVLDALGWKEGTNLNFDIDDKGVVYIRKV